MAVFFVVLEANIPIHHPKHLTMQKKTKWLIGLIAALVVVNIALMMSIWLKNDGGKTPDTRNFLAQDLNLEKRQEKVFDSLRMGYFERMYQYKKKMQFVKERLFDLLKDEQKNNQIKNQMADYLREKIIEIQEKMDKETFDHFSRLSVMLNKDQQQNF